MIELISVTADAGRLERMDSTAETNGRSIGGTVWEAVADGQDPSKPMLSTSQTTLFKTEVTLARGALGTAAVAWSMIELASVTAEAGRLETMLWIAEIKGRSVAAGA